MARKRSEVAAKLKGFSNRELAEELWNRGSGSPQTQHAAYGIVVDEYVDVALQNMYGKNASDEIAERVWEELQDAGDALDEYAWELTTKAVYDVLVEEGLVEE